MLRHSRPEVELLPSGGLRAHRSTAQPMELAARPDLSPMDRVTSAPTGAQCWGGRRDVYADEWGSGVGVGGASTAGTPAAAAAGAAGGGGLPDGSFSAVGSRRMNKSAQAGDQGDDRGLTRAEERDSLRERGRAAAAAFEDIASHDRRVETSSQAAAAGDYLQGPAAATPTISSGGSRSGAASRGEYRQREARLGKHAEREVLREHDVSARDQDGAAAPMTHPLRSAGEVDGAAAGSTLTVPLGAVGGSEGRHSLTSGGTHDVAPAELLAAQREHHNEVVCDRREFTEVEDRAVLKERVIRLVEHHPVAKDYVTTVKYVGESELPSAKPVQPLGPSSVRVVEGADLQRAALTASEGLTKPAAFSDVDTQ
eukprot:gene14900-15105_t